MSMSLSSLSVHHLCHVQQLLGKECTVRRQVSCSGEFTHEVSALASVEPLRC